jgi:DNA invertase Pin-like site-specific DNA recombinase
MKNKTPVAILIRVSTSRQETARQLTELSDYAAAKGYSVVEVCKETITGDAGSDDRQGLKRVEQLAEAGKIRKVLVHEVSRIARRNSVTHRFVEKLEEHGVSLYWHSQSIETLLPNGKRNPAAGIMLALLAEMARSELEVLRARIASGLAEARRQGKTLGRPAGSVLTRAALLQKHRAIVRLLKSGQSVRNTAKLAGRGISTVQRVSGILAKLHIHSTILRQSELTAQHPASLKTKRQKSSRFSRRDMEVRLSA